jgi:hypothetical protein
MKEAIMRRALFTIRSHDDLSQGDVSLETARRALSDARSAADTFGIVYQQDDNSFDAHCNEHAAERTPDQPCFSGTVSLF